MSDKARLEHLAIFGGRPAFAEEDALHVGRPNVGDRRRLQDRIADAIDRRRLTNDGPYVQELEHRLAEVLDVPHCVAVGSGTVGLQVAARALGLRGDAVMPSLTFVATAHALEWMGIRPVFCDVEPDTLGLDPRRAVELLTERTSALVGVHLWGRPCRASELEALAAARGLKLLFDAAHAFACTRGTTSLARFGDATVFSFHATKIVNAFEGGAIATRDAEVAARARLVRNFGFSGYDQVACLGINGKMSEASAAMALTSLESLDEFLAANRRNYHIYRESLAGVPGVALLSPAAGDGWNHHYVVLEIDPALAGADRDDLRSVLWAERVYARRYFHPGCHRMEPYASRDPAVGGRLPVTERALSRVLLLPTGTAVGARDAETVAAIVRTVLDHPAPVRARLAELHPGGVTESAVPSP
jgi:dTDP-4-amino-4,6-dideoxygalactose transaminase